MLERIKRFLSAEAGELRDDAAALHLAAAVLLVQVARADQTYDDAEIERIRDLLAREWSLDDDELDQLIAAARKLAEREVSLHEQINQINANFSPQQKFDLVRALWSVACADGRIHRHEELLVRRLADLIYVSHTDFIRAKHLALDQT